MKIKYLILILLIMDIKIVNTKENSINYKKYSYYVFNEVEKDDISFNYSEKLKNKLSENLKDNFKMKEENNTQKADILIITSIFFNGYEYLVYYFTQIPYKRFYGIITFKNEIDYEKFIECFNLDLEKQLSSQQHLEASLSKYN